MVFEEKNSFKSYLGESRKKARPAGVKIAAVIKDESPLTPVYDPTNPEADENGYIYMPNVDKTKETIDAMAASNSYNANITALNAIKAMASKALEIGK